MNFERVVIVTGSRKWFDYDVIAKALETAKPDLVVHGGATGADKIAEGWAKDHCIPVLLYTADWKQYGKSAGPRRNAQMVSNHPTAIVLAFPMRGSLGTWSCVRIAKACGMKVIVCKKGLE